MRMAFPFCVLRISDGSKEIFSKVVQGRYRRVSGYLDGGGHRPGTRSDRDNPFTNYYFGGFGNNWVDYRPEKRYREYYSFPGLEINDAGGKNFDRFMIEWNLPPIRFRGAGIPSFYASWGRFSLFSSALMTDFDHELYRRTLGNAGLQGDFRLILLSHLKITFSLGYARAFEQDRKASDEFMISLKIL